MILVALFTSRRKACYNKGRDKILDQGVLSQLPIYVALFPLSSHNLFILIVERRGDGENRENLEHKIRSWK